jgi:hypothetical protein
MRCRERYLAYEGTSNWRRFLVEELHYFISLQDFRITTSRTTRYSMHEICNGDWENAYRVMVRKLKWRTTWKPRV